MRPNAEFNLGVYEYKQKVATLNGVEVWAVGDIFRSGYDRIRMLRLGCPENELFEIGVDLTLDFGSFMRALSDNVESFKSGENRLVVLFNV